MRKKCMYSRIDLVSYYPPTLNICAHHLMRGYLLRNVFLGQLHHVKNNRANLKLDHVESRSTL